VSSIENTAGTTARASAELQQSLAGLSLPAIKEALAAWSADLGQPGQEPSSIRKAFGDLRSGVKQDFVDNRERASAYIKQQALQSGVNYSPQAMSETMSQLSAGLRGSEAQQLRAINFQEAQAGLTQTNSLLSNITGTAGQTLSGSMRFGGNALQSDQLLAQYEQQQRQQNSQYGAYAGTAVGAALGSIFPVVGTAVGAGAGGAIGGLVGGIW
jgi:hypothetical protein